MLAAGPCQAYQALPARRRKPDTGLVRPYRARPHNFRAVYIRNGWAGPEGSIEEIFATNWRCIRRWIDEEGREGLIAERAAYVRKHRSPSHCLVSRKRRSPIAIGSSERAG